MPSSPHTDASFCAYISSPKAVTKRTSNPRRLMLWAMLRPTPPGLMRTVPGLESRATSLPCGRPPMSMFIPPTTVTYGLRVTMYPFPAMQPFFIRFEICTATLERVIPARSASSCWEIMGSASIQLRICLSRCVMVSPFISKTLLSNLMLIFAHFFLLVKRKNIAKPEKCVYNDTYCKNNTSKGGS